MADVDIEVPATGDAGRIADCWIALAEGQRVYDSHLVAGDNRARITEAILRHIVSDQVLVARDPDIVGFVMFSVESGSYEQDIDRGLVENIYVEPDRRGEGIGTALLTAAESELVKRGVDAVALELMAGNEAARRFYRRAGYEPHRLEFEKRVESDTHSKGDE
jgi:ribosomal protein S18 acetylase RimI-like enzyme